MERASRQQRLVGARLPDELVGAVEAAMFVRRVTMHALLFPVIESFAKDLLRDPAVQRAINARAQASSTEAGNVKPLRGQAESVS